MRKQQKNLLQLFAKPQIWQRVLFGIAILLVSSTVLALLLFGFTEIDFNKGKALGIEPPSISGPRQVVQGQESEFTISAKLNSGGMYILYIDWGDGTAIARQRIRVTNEQEYQNIYKHTFTTKKRRANIRTWILWRGRGASERVVYRVVLGPRTNDIPNNELPSGLIDSVKTTYSDKGEVFINWQWTASDNSNPATTITAIRQPDSAAGRIDYPISPTGFVSKPGQNTFFWNPGNELWGNFRILISVSGQYKFPPSNSAYQPAALSDVFSIEQPNSRPPVGTLSNLQATVDKDAAGNNEVFIAWTWQSSDGSNPPIDVRASNPDKKIHIAGPNTGFSMRQGNNTYSWKVARDLPSGTYKIHLEVYGLYRSGSGRQTSYPTQTSSSFQLLQPTQSQFPIGNLNAYAPRSAGGQIKEFQRGDPLLIGWTWQSSDGSIPITSIAALREADPVGPEARYEIFKEPDAITRSKLGINSFNWTIPGEILPGRYRIQVTTDSYYEPGEGGGARQLNSYSAYINIK